MIYGGIYKNGRIKISKREIFKPHRIREFKIDRLKYKTIFYKTKDELPEEWRDIFIVTGKKIITPIKDFFRVFPIEDVKHKVYGYIIADGLIEIINTGKDGFRRTKLRTEFKQKSAKEWVKFLTAIGAGAVKQESLQSVAYAKKLNEFFKDDRWKRYKKLFEKIVQTPAKRKCPVCGTENYHTWANDDTYYECENGHLFKKKYTWTRTGHTPVDAPSVKRPISGIAPTYTDSPQPYESWIDGANKQLVINIGTATYKDAKKVGKKAEDIHTRRCIAKTVVDEWEKQNGFANEDEWKKEYFELYKALPKKELK